MYTVETVLKTIAENLTDEAEAMAIATETAKAHNYVAVMKEVNASYRVSVKVFYR